MDIFQRQKPLFSKSESDKLRQMCVLIAGAGGLGTHQAQQLQRIGVKKIYLYDFDTIEPGNLNRQIFYGRNDLGKSKSEVAGQRLKEFNLETEIEVINERIEVDLKLPGEIDLIFDALDNFPARFKLEEIAWRESIPLIHGGVEGWFGQLTTIIAGKTMKLVDIFAGGQKETKAAVFSPVVSTIASMQVLEGVKVYLDKNPQLLNKIMSVDLFNNQIDLIDLKN